jgi:predicted acylesterase/phospholipase RssA
VTTALVISGGGDKGAFAVGAIEVLLEKGYHFDVISGTSTGALIAPLLAIGEIDELIKLYTTVKKRDIIRFNWFGFWKAWYSTKPLERLVRRTMRGDRYDALMTSNTDILLCSVDFQTGEVLYYSQHNTVPGTTKWEHFDEYVAATLASTNQPMIMPASVLRGHQCYDGGVREIAPLKIVTGVENLERVVVISNEPPQPEKLDTRFDSYLTIGPRSLDLMFAEILINDIGRIDPGVEVLVLQPPDNLPSSGLEFIPEVMQEMRETGIKAAKQALG